MLFHLTFLDYSLDGVITHARVRREFDVAWEAVDSVI